MDSAAPSDNDLTPFLNIMNEWYAKDTSNKIKAVFKARMKNGIDMGRDLLRRSRVLVVCGHSVTEAMKNDIAVAQRLGITATTLEGILTVKGQGRR